MGKRRDLEQTLAKVLAAGIVEGERRAFEKTLLSTATHVLDREYSEVQQLSAAERPNDVLRVIAISARELWPERWRTALSGPISAVMQSATTVNAPVLGDFSLANPRMTQFLDGYISKLAETLADTSYDKFKSVLDRALAEGMSVPDTAKLLQDRIPELNKGRADLIARTETHAASNGASLEQAKQSGLVSAKTWLHSGISQNARPEHVAQNGVTVPIDQAFPDGSEYPSAPRCRCTLQYVVKRVVAA